MKIGTILENANGMRAVIGARGNALWLDTGEPIYSRLNPDEWIECEVHLPREEPTITIAVRDRDGGIITSREATEAALRINSAAGTRNRVIR
jgi:hypothetical protein